MSAASSNFAPDLCSVPALLWRSGNSPTSGYANGTIQHSESGSRPLTDYITWQEDACTYQMRWQSESSLPPPKRIVVADDQMSADEAWRLACGGSALMWRGDFQNARLLLQAMARRIDRKPRKTSPTPREDFNLHRLAQSQRSRLLGMLLIPIEAHHEITLRRAPDVSAACEEAFGPATEPYACSLRELLGAIGAHEWRKNGVEIPALGARIHPHYGVFSPVRGEYLDLIANAPIPPDTSIAFDIGTGTGVVAALLAKRGIREVTGTDLDPRAIACARENIKRLGYERTVAIEQTDLFPAGQADLVVCNPPWIPARPSSPIERAIYDPDSAMLKRYLDGVAQHLRPGGEAWLIISDLAELLGLRHRNELLSAFDAAKLEVVARHDIAPAHPKAHDKTVDLHYARSQETTSLWRLSPR